MSLFHVISVTMIGMGFLKQYMNNIIRWKRVKSVLDREVKLAYDEIVRRAPRKTGLMESSITMDAFESPTELAYGIYVPIGIDPKSPLYPLAVEFGTRTIKVGTPESPVTRWQSKTKAGATMPFMRPAAVSLRLEG